MKADYHDIKSLIKTDPLWYDQNGVPRYLPFHPELCPNIYATRVVLLLIQCQECTREFEVELHESALEQWMVPVEQWHYGDPPQHGCIGDSMNCIDRKILEEWVSNKGTGLEWKLTRRNILPAWVYGGDTEE